jgi:uncharacterized damage-inducible protein DinB
MITKIDAFLGYFDGVNRRALRDVGMLPIEAESWTPPAGAGEGAWSIGQIVAHMAASRFYFARAFSGEGWTAQPWPHPTSTRQQWLTALTESATQLRDTLASCPDDRLTQKIAPLDPGDHPASGWRLMMLMVEHDIHHRSQIDTYAGIMGWPVAHIYGRSAEEVGLARQRP